MPGLVAFREFYIGSYHIIKAVSVMAGVANKMNMMIMMVAFRTFIFAECIPDRVIGSGYDVYDPFINKCL